MATFAQTIGYIRGNAIYGSDVRTAIADAIEQADTAIITELEDVRSVVLDRELFINLEPIDESDYVMEIVNAAEPVE